MKNLTKLALAAVMAAGISAPAMAQDAGLYGDIGLSNISFDDADLLALQGHIGYDFNQYFGVEGELAFGVSEENVGGVDVKLDNEFGAFAVLSTPSNEGLEFFGRLGYVSAELEGGFGGVNASADDQAFAYGIGAKYYFDGVNGVRLDVTKYDFDDGGDATGVGVGYTRRF